MFKDILMKYWGDPYYVCGLSAAYYHGAAHQKPQVFQVMLGRDRKEIQFGDINIHFYFKKQFDQTLTVQRVVKTGYLNVSTPELTVLDLLTYRKMSGGLNHTATVLTELIEELDAQRLLELIKSGTGNAWWQRLGYILEHIEVMDEEKLQVCLNALRQYAKTQSLSWAPIAPELSNTGAKRDVFWKIIENSRVEADE